MTRLQALVISIFFTAALPIGSAAKPCDDLKVQLDKAYGFKPSKLTREQITAKSAELDIVWGTVDKNPAALLPCLKLEIAERKGDSFFRFNASNLLYKHDSSVETKKLMIETYSQADLADINRRYWLPYMAQFGFEGLDVSSAGEAWLRFGDPRYYLPEHGNRPVDKGVGALALFGSMEETLATPHLARLAAEENTDFKSIVVWLLLKQATPEAAAEVRKLGGAIPPSLALSSDMANLKMIEPRIGEPQTSRDTFVKALNELISGKSDAWLNLISQIPDGEKDMVAVFTEADLPLIRKARRFYAAKATPHSPTWYGTFTQIIITVQAKSKKSN